MRGPRYAAVAPLIAPVIVQACALLFRGPCERVLRPRPANVAPTCCSEPECQLCNLCAGTPSPQVGRPRHGQKVDHHGLASLLRVNNNSTHNGVDAAAPHTFSRLQAQYREEAS